MKKLAWRSTSMEQLGLELIPRLTYTASNFVNHSGTRSIIAGIDALISKKTFSPIIIFGRSRFGKTHLSVRLVELCLAKKRFPRLVDAQEFSGLVKSFQKEQLSGEGVVIVDDIDSYLSKVEPEQSGEFVNFWEFHRQRDIHLILFSSKPIESFPCDAHVMSRLKSASSFTIEAPSEEDLEKLVSSLAEQRGIRLGDRKISFLRKRIRRDIPSLERYFERLMRLAQLFGEKVKFPVLGDALNL